MDVSRLKMGDVIDVHPYEGVVRDHATGEQISAFSPKTDVLFDEVRLSLVRLCARSRGASVVGSHWLRTGHSAPTSPHLLPLLRHPPTCFARCAPAGGFRSSSVGRTRVAPESRSACHPRPVMIGNSNGRGAPSDANASEPPRLYAQCFGRWARSTIRPKGTPSRRRW
jgi:hypothetical protein